MQNSINRKIAMDVVSAVVLNYWLVSILIALLVVDWEQEDTIRDEVGWMDELSWNREECKSAICITQQPHCLLSAAIVMFSCVHHSLLNFVFFAAVILTSSIEKK